MGRHYVGDICAGMPLGMLTVAVVTKVTINVAIRRAALLLLASESFVHAGPLSPQQYVGEPPTVSMAL